MPLVGLSTYHNVSRWRGGCRIGGRVLGVVALPHICTPEVSPQVPKVCRVIVSRPATRLHMNLPPAGLHHTIHATYDIRSSRGDFPTVRAPYECHRIHTTYDIRCPSYGVWCNPGPQGAGSAGARAVPNPCRGGYWDDGHWALGRRALPSLGCTIVGTGHCRHWPDGH
jgi:hypothetical protein